MATRRQLRMRRSAAYVFACVFCLFSVATVAASGCGGIIAEEDAGTFDASFPDGRVIGPADGASFDSTSSFDSGEPPPRIDGSPPPPTDAHLSDGPAPDIAPPPPICDPRMCTGCCSTTGCMPGSSQTSCGFGGQACTDCAALRLECISPLPGATGSVCGLTDAGTLPDGAVACGPATCAGCCAGDICVAGTNSASCGSHGQACVVCTGPNETCVAQGAGGACVGSSAKCSPSNCLGCCDANGVCQDPTAIDACGAGGTVCQFCLPGQACNSGACQNTPGCGPANCPGCCDGDTCVSGTDRTLCGTKGAACQKCPVDTVCFTIGAKNGGQCGNSQGCGSGSCGGCCDDFLQCQPGISNTYCGNGDAGAHCGTCGTSCSAGRCAGGPSCDAFNCQGCCMPDGTCWTGGRDDTHCGGHGALCFNCGPGYVCDRGYNTCVVACSPQNCQGCCLNQVCSTGLDPTSCGSGGGVCSQCASGQSCLNGACVTLTQCGPTLCAGCCQNDVCHVGSDNMACGTGGAACQNCAASSQACVGATCR